MFELEDVNKTRLHKSNSSVIKRLKNKYNIETTPKIGDPFLITIQKDAPIGSTNINFSIEPIV